MALLFCDSFDHYPTAQLPSKYDAVTGGVIAASGRHSTSGFESAWNAANIVRKNVTASGTLIAGFSFMRSGGVNNFTDARVFMFATFGTLEQCRLTFHDTQRKFEIKRGATVLAASPTIISTDVFYYVELKVLFSTTVGTVELRINGAVDISLTGQNTAANAGTTADAFLLGIDGNAGGVVTVKHDDLYVCNTSGTINNDFLGDVRVQSIFPNANGNYSQFDGSDGNSIDNYLLVDEAAPNGDTDYVETAVVAEIDTYAMGDIAPTAGTVKGVQFVPYLRKTDAGIRTVAPIIRQSATDYVQANLPNLSTSYQYLPQIRETSPATAAAWTVAEINALEAGVKVIA